MSSIRVSAEGPVLDGIPYLRTGRDELRDRVLELIDAGREEDARVELLRDRDDWAPGEPPREEDVRRVARGETGSLREDMALLGFGPVGDYFAHRWSDPTYLSGLSLLQHHWPGADVPRVFELACGIGHFLRELSGRGARVAGADVVWAKLWLAKRHLVPDADLVCFDAATPWPVAGDSADVALCHDALYFLPAKEHVVEELCRVAPAVLVGHTHTTCETLSTGEPLDPEDYADLLPGAFMYDDAELTQALVEDRRPDPAVPESLWDARAVSLALAPANPAPLDLLTPPAGTPLVRNPLLGPDGTVRWPSPRYEAEYAEASGYLRDAPADLPRHATAGTDRVDALARRRLLLALPETW